MLHVYKQHHNTRLLLFCRTLVDEVSIASEADDSEMEYEDDEIETESEVSENESSGDEKQNESDDDSDILNNSLFPLNTSQNTVENTDAAAQQHRKKGRKRLGSRGTNLINIFNFKAFFCFK